MGIGIVRAVPIPIVSPAGVAGMRGEGKIPAPE